MCPVKRARCSNGAAGVFCRRFATTCASRCFRATRMIMIWRCTSPTGRHRALHWQALLLARAIENQAYVAGVTASAVTAISINTAATAGSSRRRVRSSRAEPFARARLDAELSLEALQDYRERFRPRDADEYTLKYLLAASLRCGFHISCPVVSCVETFYVLQCFHPEQFEGMMHIISRKVFNEATQRFPNDAAALDATYRLLSGHDFADPQVLKAVSQPDRMKYRAKW